MKTSKQSIARLHSYREALYRLKYLGFVKVFSDNLADAIGATASQVRKDFSIFGLIGNKKGGYVIDELINKLDELLGKNQPQHIIVVGSGNIGKALMSYKGFGKVGIHVVAAFDTDEAKTNRAAEIPILPLGELKEFAKQRHIKVGVIAVPDTAAQQVLEMMISAGIKGVLNFAPIRLNCPEHFVLNNVNLGIELETVVYFVNALNRQAHDEKSKS